MEWWKTTAICAVFFLILSPGFLLTLPRVSGSTKGLFSKGLFHSLETSNTSIFTHTVVFSVLAGGLLWYLDSGSINRNSGNTLPTINDSSEGGETDNEADNEADNEGE